LSIVDFDSEHQRIEFASTLPFLKLICSAMDNFPTAYGLNFNAMRAANGLCMLLAAAERSEMIEQFAVGKLGGVKLIARAMRQFHKDKDFQMFACVFLFDLCDNGHAGDSSMELEALVEVATVIKSFPEDDDLRNIARSVITKITVADKNSVD